MKSALGKYVDECKSLDMQRGRGVLDQVQLKSDKPVKKSITESEPMPDAPLKKRTKKT